MSEDAIFSEINDELRSDRMRTLWRRYGPWAIGIAALIVVGVAGNEGWRWYQNSVSAASSEKYYAAYELIAAGDTEAAQSALNDVISTGSGQYPDLARFAQASLLAEEGKTTEAVAAFDALAATLGNRRLRELALLHAASLLVDNGDVTAVQSRLVGIVDAEGGFRNVALEILGLAQYAAGETDAALTSFETIRLDPAAAQDQLQRLDVFEAQLMSEGAQFTSAE